MDSIVDLIIEELVDAITTACIDNIEDGDPTIAGRVKAGLLQESPQLPRISITVHSGDPEDSTWEDGPLGQTEGPFLSGAFEGYEVGGGYTYCRKFTIALRCFFTSDGATRDEARSWAWTVMSRIQKAVSDAGSLGGIEDDFGECVWIPGVSNVKLTEGGGPPSQWIWRGSLHVQYLTHHL
jgi:hypothetical protein